MGRWLFLTSFATILCIDLVLCAKEETHCSARKYLRSGLCPSDPSTFSNCVDACDGTEVTTKDNCSQTPECCFVQGRCVMKNKTAHFNQKAAKDEEYDLFEKLKAKFKLPSNDTTPQQGKSSARNLQIGNFPGGIPPVPGAYPPITPFGGLPQITQCTSFPYNCPPVTTLDQIMTPPVNIPYCQREYCSQGDMSLENDLERCLMQPGCYFDREIHTLRKTFGHQVLPTVPICHLAIRNHAFLKRTHAHVEQFGKWNPSITECLLMNYFDEIYSPPRGCDMNDVIAYFGYLPKMAGWLGILEKECYLINGCWKPNQGCFYPMQLSELVIKSGQEENGARKLNPTSQTFGMPKCQHFDSSTPQAFLKSYHNCLASGCALDSSVSNQMYYYNLWNVTQSLPVQLQYLSWVDIANSEIRADNFEEQMRKYQRMSIPDRTNSFMNSFNTGSNAQVTNMLYSLNSGANNLLNLGLGVNQGLNPMLGPNLGLTSFLGNTFPGSNIVTSVGQGNCPFKPVRLYNFPPLKGSFTGCCQRNLCYLPRKSQNQQKSGIAGYYSAWGQWPACSKTCNGGKATRTRRCISDKGARCGGIEEETHDCNTARCPEWSSWGPYAPCSVSCGPGGKTTRTRKCSGFGCVGSSQEMVTCNSKKCPKFSGWTQWSKCSVTCGEGIKIRYKFCVDGGVGECPKDDPSEEIRCRSFCGNIVWAKWSDCDYTTCTRMRAPACVYNGGKGFCQNFPKPLSEKCDQMKCYCRKYPRQPLCKNITY